MYYTISDSYIIIPTNIKNKNDNYMFFKVAKITFIKRNSDIKNANAKG